MIKGKTRTNQPITELTGVGTKMYKHEVYLSLKTSSASLYGYFNFTSTDNNPITARLDTSKYCIIDFKTSSKIGFIGGSSSLAIPLESYGSHLIISFIPYGGNELEFSASKVTTYNGSSYFGSEDFTECSLTDSVTPL